MKLEEKWIWALLGVSAIIICCTDFLFDEIPECSNFVYKLGRLFNNLSLAYIASVMFYWIVVLIPDKRKKKNLYEYVFKRTGNVIGDCESLITELIKASAYAPANKNLTEADFRAILTKIAPHGNAPMYLQDRNATWVEYLYEQRRRSLDFIERILGYIIFLESESDYIKLIANVKDCTHFNHLPHYIGHQMKNPDLTFISKGLYEYYVAVKLLKEYVDKNFSKYSKDYTLTGLQYF